jgi:hypothetical protein
MRQTGGQQGACGQGFEQGTQAVTNLKLRHLKLLK